MKIVRIIIVMAFIIVTPLLINAQPKPPSNGYIHGSGGNQPMGGDAPVDGGLSVLLLLGATYGIKKIYQFRSGK